MNISKPLVLSPQRHEAIHMRQVWLKNDSGRSNTPFIKVYKKEFVKVGEEMVIVHCDKNYQIVLVENHPEMAFMKGRPYLLEVEAIKSLVEEQQQAARKEENHEG